MNRTKGSLAQAELALCAGEILSTPRPGDCGGGASRLAMQEGLSEDLGTARVDLILVVPVGSRIHPDPLRKLCFRGLKMLSAEPPFLG